MTDTTLTRRTLLAGIAALPGAGLLAHAIAPTVAFAQGAKVVTAVAASEVPVLLSFVNTSSTIWSAKHTEGLLEFDFDLNAKPLLATEWNVSEDGLTYTFKLRQGVKWHDGEAFDAEDVLFSLRTSQKLHPRNRSTFAQITEFLAPDPHTVVLKLAHPTQFLLRALSAGETPIVPSHLYKDGDDPLTHPNNTAPIGTGPYVFKEWVRGSHIIFDRNPDYWDPAFPQIDRLVIRTITDAAARTIAFETGDVDLGNRTPVPYRDLEALEKLPHIRIEPRGYTYSPPNIVIVEANLRDGDLAKLPVRQAIAHLIDREALAKIVFYNRALPSASPVVPYHKDFHLAEPSPYAFDVAAAEALLEQAGYPRGANGVRLNLTLDFTSDGQRIVGEFLRAALARAGIAIELRGQDMGTLIARIYGDQAYQLHLASISNLYDPQVGVQRLYWSKNIIKGVAFSNGTGYANPEVDALLEAAALSADHAERVRLWHEVQRIVARDVPSFPLVAAEWLTIANTRITGDTPNGEGAYDGSLRELQIV